MIFTRYLRGSSDGFPSAWYGFPSAWYGFPSAWYGQFALADMQLPKHCVHIHIHIHMHMHIHIHMYTYTYMNMYMCIYKNMLKYIYIYT
jgi:hypothetical protein